MCFYFSKIYSYARRHTCYKKSEDLVDDAIELNKIVTHVKANLSNQVHTLFKFLIYFLLMN